jgi:ABC-type Mn2+/Zn2+ transport system ATPase subunit
MVSISLQQLGKKFRKEWIFRGLDAEIPSGTKLVILGGNGSGKSTLLQVISGFVSPNEGQVVFKDAEKLIDAEETKNYISFDQSKEHLADPCPDRLAGYRRQTRAAVFERHETTPETGSGHSCRHTGVAVG